MKANLQTTIELLPNDLWRVQDRGSGLTGLYERSGEYRSGDLRINGYVVVSSPFNKASYPNLIGRVFDNPPSYAQVLKLVYEIPEEDRPHSYRFTTFGICYCDTCESPYCELA